MTEAALIWSPFADQATAEQAAAALLDTAVARLAQIHPYDTPAITGWRCDAAAPATLAWLDGLTPP